MRKKFLCFCLILFLVSLTACINKNATSNSTLEGVKKVGFVHADGIYVKDGEGKDLILKGVGLGGWMLQEGYMLGTSGAQHKIRAKLETVAGKKTVDTFYKEWLDNFITEEDIKLIANWGFNSVRLPMHYELYFNEDGSWAGDGSVGIQLTDNLIKWCTKYDLYVLLDLHAAPGGQGNNQDISDRRDGESLWENTKYQDMTVEFWKQIAQKYKNETQVAGYDLLNETNYTFPTGNNKPLSDLFMRIIDAIREIDSNHLLILEGNDYGGDYRGMDELAHYDKANNTGISFHAYWSKNTDASLNYYLELRNSWQMPLWRGEIGENTNTWFTNMVKLMDKHKIGWANWPWKKFGSHDGPLEIVKATKWSSVASYLSGKSSAPSSEYMQEALKEMIEAIKLKNCRQMIDVAYAWVGLPDGNGSKPYAEHNIPGTIFLSDYDLGEWNVSWYDTGYQNISGKTNEKAGNMGLTYRNDGVDIWKSDDNNDLSNGYFIGEIADGEWTEYTMKKVTPGKYGIRIRYRSKTNGKIQLTIDGIQLLEKELTSTNGNWTTAILGDFDVTSFSKLRVNYLKGGYDISLISFK